MHYAAALQGTTNGLNNLYTILVENGADENVVDVVMNALYLSIMIQKSKYCIHLLRGTQCKFFATLAIIRFLSTRYPSSHG